MFLFINDILYALIQYMLHITMLRAAQKNKKIFHIVVKLRTKIIWTPQKYVVATNNKKFVTPKRDSCWLNLFGAQKLKTYCQKILSVVYKYMFYWLEKFCVARKILFDIVQELKLVCINIINFCQNGAHKKQLKF